MNANASAALEKQVEKFWLLEGYNDSNKPRTKIEKLHEKNFEENVTRTKDGRFQVLGLVFLSGLVSGGSEEAQRGSSANKY
jgi:hypothetical protein